LGLGARGKAKIKVRQPLAEAVVVARGREREAIESLAEIVREELNVRSVRFVAAAEELGSYEVKANYRALGPLFGKDMPLAADALESAVEAHREYVAGETLAVELRAGNAAGGQAAQDGDASAEAVSERDREAVSAAGAFARSRAEIEGHPLQIALRRVEPR